MSGKEFAVKGKWINPQRDLIREIQVFKTTEKISETKIAILDYIVSGEGISSQTVMVANVEHELVTDLFITSKPPTPSTIERIEKHNRTEEQSISTTTYEQFDSNEKIALEIAIVFGHKPLSQVLPSFYAKGYSKSTLYYYHKEGENKLASKGLLDRQGRPTSLAFNFIPENVLKKMTQDLHFQLIQLQEEKNRIESAFFDSSSGLRKMKEQSRRVRVFFKKCNPEVSSPQSNPNYACSKDF